MKRNSGQIDQRWLFILLLLLLIFIIFGVLLRPTPSDARLKTNIVPLTGAVETLDQVRGVSFEWNETAAWLARMPGQKDIGVIAQEVEPVLPDVVSTGLDGYKRVDYEKLTPVLVEAIKELKAEVDALKAENQALRRQFSDLKQVSNGK